MRILIKNGRIITAVDDYQADILVEDEKISMIGKEIKIEWSDKNCITIVLCAKGYPSNYIKNSEIKNLFNISSDENNQIFHAGTYLKNNKTYSIGGRVLNVTSSSESLIKARNNSLEKISKINLTDGFFRKDIGWRVINNK